MAESTSLCPTRNPDSPYYLNQEEQSEFYPSGVILSQANDNYIYWKLRFQCFFRFTNKTGFIDGTIAKPDPSSPLFEPWTRCDEMVKTWLLNSMSDDIFTRVMNAKTAQKMWEDVRRVFVPNLDYKIYQLRRSLATMKQGGDSVEKYYEKMSKAWVELAEYSPAPKCSCGGCKCEIAKQAEEARENEKRYAFLMGLNEKLSFMRPIIMLKNPPPSTYHTYLLVENEELSMKAELSMKTKTRR